MKMTAVWGRSVVARSLGASPYSNLSISTVPGLGQSWRNSIGARRQFIRYQRRHPNWVFPLRRLMRKRPQIVHVFYHAFLRTERPQAAKLAVAAAVEIADTDPVLLSRHPFVRRIRDQDLLSLVQESLRQKLLGGLRERI